MLLHNFLFEL